MLEALGFAGVMTLNLPVATSLGECPTSREVVTTAGYMPRSRARGKGPRSAGTAAALSGAECFSLLMAGSAWAGPASNRRHTMMILVPLWVVIVAPLSAVALGWAMHAFFSAGVDRKPPSTLRQMPDRSVRRDV